MFDGNLSSIDRGADLARSGREEEDEDVDQLRLDLTSLDDLFFRPMRSNRSEFNSDQVKPQKMVPSLNGDSNELGLDLLKSTSKVLYCDKYRFVSAKSTMLKKHLQDHMATHFYCFYCNHVSYSETELQAHLQQHTRKYPFNCQYCGQGYLRGEHLLKHVQRLHGKDIAQGLSKAEVRPSGPVSGVHRTKASSLRPTVKVTIPPSITTSATMDKEERRRKRKPADTNVHGVPKVVTEQIVSLNEPIQHNRALTVPLPEEVSIPAGCLVEFIEVKTVNGTKELKLRLVSQQENDSVLDDSRGTISQNITLGNPLSSTFNNCNPLKSGTMGKCSANVKKCATKNMNVELLPTNGAKSIPSVTPQETMNQNGECPSDNPAKVPRIIVYPINEGIAGIKPLPGNALSPNAGGPTVVPTKMTSSVHQGASVSKRSSHKKKKSSVIECCGIPAELQVTVKDEPRDNGGKNSVIQDIKEEPVKPVSLDQKRISPKSPSLALSVSATAYKQAMSQHSTFSDCLEEAPGDPSYVQYTMSNTECKAQINLLSTTQPDVKECSLSESNSSFWTQSVTSTEPSEHDTPEPERFPVISSVFSLSQQPDDVTSSIQPLVKALRGIVMSKNIQSVKASPDHTKTTSLVTMKQEMPNPGNCAEVVEKDVGSKQCITQETCEIWKILGGEKCQYTQTETEKNFDVKEEAKVVPNDSNPQSTHPSPDYKPLVAQEEAISNNATKVDSSAGIQGQMPQSAIKAEVPSKFLTVSLKRIHEDSWKQSPKRRNLSKPKTLTPIGNTWDDTVLRPVPLKMDQPVIRPSPNQPVVVLNHPNPTVAKRTQENSVGDAAKVEPKCDILKMRLSKVVGQKYEVIGCTVGLFS